MVLYLSIQLRCRNKNKPKMFIKRRTHKNWLFFILPSLSWRVIEPNVHTAFSIVIRKLIIKTWYILRLMATRNVRRWKKHLKLLNLLIERAKLQFKPLIYEINWNNLPLN